MTDRTRAVPDLRAWHHLPAVERFARRLVKLDNGCWTLLGTPSAAGYFYITDAGVTIPAHRWSYQHHVGPVSPELMIDHLCRNRGCVNPAHLEPVTHQVNVLRGISPAAEAAVKTHCIRGHEFTPENTIHVQNVRRCRECKRERDRRYWQKRKVTA